MHPNVTLPPLNYHGYLPQGVHETTLEQVHERFVFNPARTILWERLQQFLGRVVSTDFSHIYMDGGFITSKPAPEDIDMVLQTRGSGPEAYRAIQSLVPEGEKTIYAKYSIDLFFWSQGISSDKFDLRLFFQYIRPQDAAPLGLKEGARRGIVVIKL